MTVTQLREGDYRPDGAGGFALATGGAGVLERVLFLLTARRGGFPLLPEVGNRYMSGWLEESRAAILVSNGVGTSGAPVRLFAPPQIHLITLKSR